MIRRPAAGLLAALAAVSGHAAPGPAPIPAAKAGPAPIPAVEAGPAPIPAVEAGPAGAFAVVHDYYTAIEGRRYRAAYALWHGDRSYAQVRAGYARTRQVRVRQLAPCVPEGAAGSLYCAIPVQVDAVADDGGRQRFRGSFTLRRVNDVDGSTPAQRRWHIVAARLAAR